MKSSDNEFIELTGTFTERKFRSADGGYCVLLYQVKGMGYVTVVGSNLPEVDYPVKFSGYWDTHPSFGEQFKVDMVINSLPDSKDKMISFILASPAKITRRAATVLVDTVGVTDFWNVLYEHPETMYRIADIGEKNIHALQNAAKGITIQSDLKKFFQNDLSLTNTQYQNICALFPEEPARIVDEVKANPYLLLKAGYPFEELDRFTKKHLAIPSEDYRRMLGVTQAVLMAAQTDCHVGLPAADILNKIKDLLRPCGSVPDNICRQFINAACKRKDIAFEEGMLYLNRAVQEEAALVEKLSVLASAPSRTIPRHKFDSLMEKYAKKNGFALSPDQQAAVWTVLTEQISVITGGPGTGKSTILDAILYCWKHFYRDKDWILMAPTGKAAVRMTETTGESAYTIHSTLQLTPTNNIEQMDALDAEVSQSLIILDECSMIDLSVASSLVRALANAHTGTQHLVFVGDPDQLPSVGYGNVLADMITSNAIPVCHLNTIYRQAAGNPIITNSLKMKADDDTLQWDHPMFRRFHVGSDADNMDAACTLYLRLVKKVGIENVVLLSPYHEKTDISTNILNAKLQEAINPKNGRPGIKRGQIELRVNDRVMQLKNTEWLSNGDVGTVTEVHTKAKGTDACLYVTFESGIVQGYNHDEIHQLDLAYAMTVHKSQGSQYKCVITILPNKTSTFLTRSILYTAITRAKEYDAVIGPTATIRYMIHNARMDVRHTRLIQRMQKTITEKTTQNAAS